MIEQWINFDFPVKIDSVADWSLIIAFLGGLAFYFGKLISEVSPEKDNNPSIYTGGVVFMIGFIFLPFLALKELFLKFLLDVNIFIACLIQFLIFVWLGFRLVNYTKQRINQMPQINIKDRFIPFKKRFFAFLWVEKVPVWLLYIIGILNIASAYNVVLNATVYFKFAALLTTICNLSIFAIVYQSQNITKSSVVIHLENGKVISGTLLKVEEDVVSLINKNKVYVIQQSKIVYLEKNL